MLMEVLDDEGRPVEVLDDDDQCTGNSTYSSPCGGCGRCLLAQAYHWGNKVQPAGTYRAQCVAQTFLEWSIAGIFAALVIGLYLIFGGN